MNILIKKIFIYTTTNRGLKLKERFKNLNGDNIIVRDDDGNEIFKIDTSTISFKSVKGGNVKIDLNEIAVISNNLIKLNKTLSFLNDKYYNKTIIDLYNKYSISLKRNIKNYSRSRFLFKCGTFIY